MLCFDSGDNRGDALEVGRCEGLLYSGSFQRGLGL